MRLTKKYLSKESNSDKIQ